MRTVSSAAELRDLPRPVGFVPTMGALHDGHAALVRRARDECRTVVASVYVNPAQFNDPSDLESYPRTPEEDAALLDTLGCDVLFAPESMYAPEATTAIDVGPLATVYEGARRPGHFNGVCLVVCKLFHAVAPDRAYFGRKDAQQLAVIRRMVADLDFGIAIVPVETVRAESGLALSSRNRRLSEAGLDRAAGISAGLFRARDAFAGGERDPARLAEFARTDGLDYEYCVCVDPVDFGAPKAGFLLIAAASVEGVRLIDNLPLP
ncbi:MAG: pantoate--beta-alanine ligase [Planctomycetota bacterium]|jgi:pantoate--beta-alanine ligase